MIRTKMQIIMISIMFLFLIPLVIVLPIVLTRKQKNHGSKLNTSVTNAPLVTSSSLSSTTMEITTEQTVTTDPLITVFFASKNALTSWTVNGSVFVDNGVLYPFLDGSWYICGEYGSSISRSFVLNDEQIAIYYATSQLHVETDFIGDIELSKSPSCSVLSPNLLANKTDSMTNNILEKRYTGRFRICRNDVDMLLTIAFLNATSCIKHLFISIWNPFRPFAG